MKEPKMSRTLPTEELQLIESIVVAQPGGMQIADIENEIERLQGSSRVHAVVDGRTASAERGRHCAVPLAPLRVFGLFCRVACARAGLITLKPTSSPRSPPMTFKPLRHPARAAANPVVLVTMRRGEHAHAAGLLSQASSGHD